MPDRPVTPEQTNQRLRGLPVIAPDHDSITRFVPFVSVAPRDLNALLDVAEAATEHLREEYPYGTAHPADASADRLARRLARLAGERSGA